MNINNIILLQKTSKLQLFLPWSENQISPFIYLGYISSQKY